MAKKGKKNSSSNSSANKYQEYLRRTGKQSGQLKGNYFTPGRYGVVLNSMHFKEGYEGDFTIVETTVLKADPDPFELKPGESYPRVNQQRSQVIKWDKKWLDMAANNVRNVANAVMACVYSPKQIQGFDEDDANDFIDAIYKGEHDGVLLYLVAEHQKKKKSEGFVTVHKWYPYDDQLGPIDDDEVTVEEDEDEDDEDDE